MAFKEDTFWKDHPSIFCTEAPSRGIEMKSAFRWFPVWADGLIVLTSLGSVYLVTWSGPFDFNVFMNFYLVLAPIFLPINTLVESARRRYCLVVDERWAEAEGAVRRRYVESLHHIVRTPTLYDRLLPPAGSNRFKYWSVVTEMPDNLVFLSVLWMGVCVLPVAWVHLANLPILLLSLIAVIALLLRMLWLRRLVMRSVQDFGYGTEASGSNVGSRFQFADVKHASIHIDPWLCQPYLRLELGTNSRRYYNPTDDDLYLLRLVKHRMPDGVLMERQLPAG